MAQQLSKRAQELHSKMIAYPSSTMFNQEELLQVLKITSAEELLNIIQELVGHNLVKLGKQGDELKFQPILQSEASKITSMTEDEAMIYSHIESSGREGIWTKTIKAKTNLHQHVVVRCLKSLENQRFIKSIKSVKYPTRKIYMLYNLQPSIEVTGGPWFTDSELDTEFIDSLLKVIWMFAAFKSYPTVFQPPAANINKFQASYPANRIGAITLDSIADYIKEKNIINVELEMHDIRSLCEVLVYDDKLELVPHTTDTYKASWQSILEAGYGRAYEDSSNGTTKDSQLIDSLQKSTFSIFDSHLSLGRASDDSDLVFFDSWIYQ